MRALLLIVLVVAVAFGGLIFLRSAPSGGEVVGVEAGAGRSQGDAIPSDGGSAPLVGIADEAAQRSTGSSAGRADLPPATSAKAGATPAAASARVTGRVTDGAGRPIAGADVLARPSGDLWTPGQDRRTTPSGVTDVLGLFDLESAPGDVTLRVGADGFALFEQSAQLTDGEARDVGDLRLAAGVTLRGRVVDPSGVGVPGAEIVRVLRATGQLSIVSLGERFVAATTDATGAFQVDRQAVGPYEFSVTHPLYPAAAFAGSTSTANEVKAGLVISLRAGATLTGIVTGIPAAARPGLAVRVTRSVGPSDFEVFELDSSGMRVADVREDGSFEVTGLERGGSIKLDLSAGPWRWDGSSRRSVTQQAKAGDTGVRIPYSTGSSLSFQVRSVAGDPIELSSVEVGRSYLADRSVTVVDAATGAYRVDSLWPLEDGTPLSFAIRVPGFVAYERDAIVLQAGVDFDMGLITLAPRPQLCVTVTSQASGRPVAGASVRLRNALEPSGNVRSFRMSRSFDVDAPDGEAEAGSAPFQFGEDVTGTTDDAGVCFLDATPGEAVEVSANHPEHAPVTSGSVALEVGQNRLDVALQLPVGGAIDVLVVDTTGAPAADYPVIVKGIDEGPDPSKTTDEAGRITRRGLPAGPNYLRLGDRLRGDVMMLPRISIAGGPSVPEPDWSLVEVVAGATVEAQLVAPARGEIEGVLTELGVPLAGANIELRDAGDPDPFGILMLGGGATGATSDARGEFTLTDVEEGEHELVIEHRSRAMPAIWPVTVRPGSNKLEIDLAVTTVEGRVLGPDGKGLVGATVEAERQRTGPQRTTVARVVLATDDGQGGIMMSIGDENTESTRTDDEGRFLLRGVQAGVTLVVVARAEGLDEARSAPFDVAAGGSKDDLELRFQATGAVRIEVENSTPGLIAILRRRGDVGGDPRIEMLNGPATTIEGLAPGPWTARMSSTVPGSNLSTDPDDVEFDVVADETASASFVVR